MRQLDLQTSGLQLHEAVSAFTTCDFADSKCCRWANVAGCGGALKKLRAGERGKAPRSYWGAQPVPIEGCFSLVNSWAIPVVRNCRTVPALESTMRPSIPVQVLIVSDQPLVAIGLQLELLSVEPRACVTVVDNWGRLCAGGGLVEEAVVILADLDVQQGERRALVDRLCEIGRFGTVLALTARPSHAERERLSGACAGYLSKASTASELRDALRQALRRGGGQCDAEMPVLFRAAC